MGGGLLGGGWRVVGGGLSVMGYGELLSRLRWVCHHPSPKTHHLLEYPCLRRSGKAPKLWSNRTSHGTRLPRISSRLQHPDCRRA